MNPFDGPAFAKSLPESPGVYRMYDARECLLYVGKAKSLQKRVGSYFSRTLEDQRIAVMVRQIARMEFTVVRTEAEALVLESRLIKTEKPRYNIQLRDDRGYPYLHLSTDKEVPQLRVHRGRRGKTGRYFGPFPSSEAVHAAHDLLQKHFQLRTCSDTFFAGRSRPCLEFQIGRCSAPCVGKIAHDAYMARVHELEAFLEGKSSAVIDAMVAKMDAAAAAMRFEEAACWRDRVTHLRAASARMDVESGEGNLDAIAIAIRGGVACVSVVFVRQGQMLGSRSFTPQLPLDASCEEVLGQFLAQYYLDKPRPPELLLDREPEDMAALQEAFGKTQLKARVRGDRAIHLEAATRNADAGLTQRLQSKSLTELRRADLVRLLELPELPTRIECFDISHTMGELTVASCVVFGPEGPVKSAYRRYNIEGITPGDDYAAMRQALTRRLSGDTPPPDLLLIDGGKGQVKQALLVCEALDITVPIVGVAKGPERKAGEETLLLVDQNKEIQPGQHSPALHLIQQVRDEAHRFAIEGHRRRREKARVHSSLEDIPGVGPQKRQALLKAFGGLQGIKVAGAEELMRVPGISRALADLIVAAVR